MNSTDRLDRMSSGEGLVARIVVETFLLKDGANARERLVDYGF